MSSLCIIPARGGSKRIPRKNIKEFLRKPIIGYSIEVAIESVLFEEVMVSTDDVEIAKIAQRFGASVPFFRSAENSNDHAPLADVINEVKDCYLRLNKTFDYICCIFPTAPLITVENLNTGYQLLISKDVDSVRPVVKYPYPVQRALKMIDGKIEMFYPEYIRTCSQDLEPVFHDAGQFYWMKYEKALNGINKYGFEISQLQAQDIDTEEDWVLAEMKYKKIYYNSIKGLKGRDNG